MQEITFSCVLTFCVLLHTAPLAPLLDCTAAKLKSAHCGPAALARVEPKADLFPRNSLPAASSFSKLFYLFSKK